MGLIDDAVLGRLSAVPRLAVLCGRVVVFESVRSVPVLVDIRRSRLIGLLVDLDLAVAVDPDCLAVHDLRLAFLRLETDVGSGLDEQGGDILRVRLGGLVLLRKRLAANPPHLGHDAVVLVVEVHREIAAGVDQQLALVVDLIVQAVEHRPDRDVRSLMTRRRGLDDAGGRRPFGLALVRVFVAELESTLDEPGDSLDSCRETAESEVDGIVLVSLLSLGDAIAVLRHDADLFLSSHVTDSYGLGLVDLPRSL